MNNSRILINNLKILQGVNHNIVNIALILFGTLLFTISFAIGIEIAQLLTVLMIIILNYIIVKFLKFNARKWEIIISGIILFQALRMSFANFPLSI